MSVMLGAQSATIPELDIDLELLPPNEANDVLDRVSSDAFLTYVLRILLDREFDGANSMRHQMQLSTVHGRRALVQDIMKDPEFLERYGVRQRRRMPVDDFICTTFHDVLARWPDDGAMNTYKAMARKRNGRARVQSAILRSSEGRRRAGGRLARIAGLARFAGSGPLLSPPLLARFRAVRIALRLIRDRYGWWPDIFRKTHDRGRAGSNFPTSSTYRPASVAEWNKETPDPIDPATASAQDINDWAFRHAYLDAHRQALVDRETIA